MIYLILMLIILILSIPYLVDLFINGKDIIKRKGIGKWDSEAEWENKITNKCIEWVTKTPIIKKTDNNNFLLLDMIKGNYKSSTIQSWQTGLVYLALVENDVHKFKSEFINDEGIWRDLPNEVDFALLSYAILKDTEKYKEIKPAMDYMYDIIKENQCKEDGCVAYRKNCVNQRYVDTVGFVSAFLALYGKIYDCVEAIQLSKKVIITYWQKGIERNSFLPYHAYDVETNIPLGICGWGRGAGWFLLGLIDTYLVTLDEELEEIIHLLADKYCIYQNENGSFSSILQLKNGSESSATSVFAYFYACCYNIFKNEKYKDISKKSLHYLQSVTRKNGEIDYSQGDTKGIGFYSLTSNIMPFTQGMTLRTIIKLRGE